jgi:hypothetical protein
LDTSPILVAGVIVTFLNDINRQSSAISASIGSNDNGTTDQEVSFWNNVYLCAGLTPVKVGEYLDISRWVTEAAGPLINNLLSHPKAGALQSGQQLLRSRLIWLLGMFVC